MKDKITNICGIVIVITGAIATAEKSGVVMPSWVDSTCIVLAALSLGLIGFYTGKPNA